jgi:hypothetical protein
LIEIADLPAAMAGAHHEREMQTAQPYSIEYGLTIVCCLSLIFPIPNLRPAVILPPPEEIMQE